jgi:sulfate permease, SulP family
VLAGVVVGVVLSLGWPIHVATSPPMPLMGRERGTRVFRELDEHPDDEIVPGVPVLRLDGGLFFATAEALEERVRGLTDTGAEAIVLDCKGVNFVDSQGAEKLAEIRELLDLGGWTLRLAHVKPQVLRVLRADGVVDRLGADHIHGNVAQALDAERSAERHRLTRAGRDGVG